MNDRPSNSPRSTPGGIAPADARPHRPWPRWRKIAAYAVLAALATCAIWYVDRQVRQQSPSAMTVEAAR